MIIQSETNQSLKASVNISASYGPIVKLIASVEGSTSRCQTESRKAASEFSQDVTQKSSQSITQKTSTTVTVTSTVRNHLNFNISSYLD